MTFAFVFFITSLLCLKNFKTLLSHYGLPLASVMCSCRKYPWSPTKGNGNSEGGGGVKKKAISKAVGGCLKEVFFQGVWVRLVSKSSLHGGYGYFFWNCTITDVFSILLTASVYVVSWVMASCKVSMDVHVVVIFFISGNFYFSASLATLPYPKTKEKQNLPEIYKKLTTTNT